MSWSMSNYIPKFQAIQLLISSSIDLQFLKSFTIVVLFYRRFILVLRIRYSYFLLFIHFIQKLLPLIIINMIIKYIISCNIFRSLEIKMPMVFTGANVVNARVMCLVIWSPKSKLKMNECFKISSKKIDEVLVVEVEEAMEVLEEEKDGVTSTPTHLLKKW